jgi:hypothetical protein
MTAWERHSAVGQLSEGAPLQSAVLQRKCACGSHAMGGQCSECDKKREGTLQRRSAHPTLNTAVSDEAPPIVSDVLRASGRPLDAASRAFFEPRFGRDFSNVRVHTDAQAAESARAVNALAYTVGRDVVFNTNHYQPFTTVGQKLLAHELTHVAQQHSLRSGSPLEIYEADGVLEREADAAAASLDQDGTHGQIAHTAAMPVLQRQPAEQLRPTPPRPAPPVRTPPSLRVIEGGLSRATARSAERTGWRFFWRAVARRFALRGAIAVALSAADGPLPIGELISLGLALWTIWEIVQLWEVLWAEANRLQNPEAGETPGAQPQPETQPEPDPRRRCRETNPTFLPCTDSRTKEDVVTSFANSRGIDVTGLECEGQSSFGAGAIDECAGAPGQSWHCRVNGSEFVVSIFGCFCCQENGEIGFDWRGPHQSPGQGRRPDVRRQDGRRDRRERSRERDRQRRDRRDNSEEED